MDASFWFNKWERNEIGFHRPVANPLLVNHFDALSLSKTERVFLPLCGKTLDIGWLLGKGHQVVGAELSQMAIEQLFESLGIKPKISVLGTLRKYSGPALDIFVGDVFAISSTMLGRVDAIYDRGALVALPNETRVRYTKHLVQITETAPQLVVTYEYDQRVVAGPPFSITTEELTDHYGASYNLTLLKSEQEPNGMKGKCPATESVWVLKKK